MKRINTLLTVIILAIGSAAMAEPKCTTEPKAKWKNEEEFKKSLLTDGYKIKKFKVTKGNCYEIYGWNKEGQKIEIYFNPVDGSKTKTEIY